MRVNLILAWRYLAGRKLRTALTTLAIALGVMVLFGMNAILPSILEAFQHNVLASAEQVDLTVSNASGGLFDAARVGDVAAVDGVAVASGVLERQIVLPPSLVAEEGVGRVSLVGLDPATATRVRSYSLARGRFLAEGDDRAALLPQSLSEKLGLDVGERLRLPSAGGTAELEIAGILNTRALPGEEQVYVTLPAAQALLGLPGQVIRVEAIFAPGIDRQGVEAAVLARLGGGFQIGAIESGSELLAAVEMGQMVFALFGFIALAMGAFIIYNTFRTVVLERRRDLGILRAIGAGRRTILGLILAESLLQGVIGSALGLLGGYLIATGMIAFFNPIVGDLLFLRVGPPRITPANLIGSVALGLIITLLGGLLPALSAARVPPLEALRPMVAAAFERAARRRSLVGLALLVLAVLGLISGNTGLAGLGTLFFMAGLVLVAPALTLPLSRFFGRFLGLFFAREGRIAEGNLARQPNRAAITAAVAMIGLAFVVAMAGTVTSIREAFLTYLDRSLGADVLVMPESLLLGSGNVGATPALAGEIGDIPGIAGVTTLRLATTDMNGTSLQVLGIDPQTYPRLSGLVFSRGEAEPAFAALGRERAIILNGITASQAGVQVGQVLSLRTAEGQQQYRVVGIAMDYLNAKLATGYISQANLEADFHQTADALIIADIAAEADAAAVRESVAGLVAAFPAFTLLDWQSFRATQVSFFEQLMALWYGVIVVFSVPVLMAMINTLAINVLERTREIGVLRAVGSTRRQVQRMIRAESLLLAALGTAFGLLAGLWLGYVIVGSVNATAYVMSYHFPGAGIVAAIAAGLIIGVLAAAIPARRATHLDIITALRYE